MVYLTKFDTFFAYYESRCPIGGLHDFRPIRNQQNEVCRKCKLQSVLILDHVSPSRVTEARKYYDKYHSTYEEERKVVTSGATLFAAVLRPVPAVPVSEATTFAQTWSYDYGKVVRAAGLLADRGITPATIEAIGATENRDYVNIRGGINAPPAPTTRDDPRILAADSDVRIFLTDYNMLRYCARLLKPPRRITELLNKAAVPTSERETLAEQGRRRAGDTEQQGTVPRARMAARPALAGRRSTCNRPCRPAEGAARTSAAGNPAQTGLL